MVLYKMVVERLHSVDYSECAIYWCFNCFLCLRSYLLLLFVRCCQNGCRFLTFSVATEFTAGSVSEIYWLLTVFVVAAGFTNGSARSLVIVFLCMSSF